MLSVGKEAVEEFVEDVSLLWCKGNITKLESPPSPLTFLRDFVAPSQPCIIMNGMIRHGSPFHLTLDDLVAYNPDVLLTVNVTPDGHGDCVRLVETGDYEDHGNQTTTEWFVQPEECRMTISEFREILRKESPQRDSVHSTMHLNYRERVFEQEVCEVVRGNEYARGVVYYSMQNECLRNELRELWEREMFDKSVTWAEEAFGVGPPDAVNIWIGNEQAVSSMHKDHYENLFYVLSGEKVFTICPPANAAFLQESEFPNSRFVRSSGDWKVIPEACDQQMPQTVRWIGADVKLRHVKEHVHAHPGLEFVHPMEVKVKAGEMLYLPSLWFHHVSQSCETVGINYWYDMRFDGPSWCYFHLLQQARLELEADSPDD